MIEVKDLVKTFDSCSALDGLSLHIPPGSVYGLIGPNGAGKTTLLRHLAGIYRQDAGTVTMDGEPIFENCSVKQRIAFIPDDPFSYPQASIRDMLELYRSLYPRFSLDLYQRLGEAFRLPEKQPLRRYSRGMQKQAAFWLAISAQPDLMILDEPVDGLDPVMRRQVWNILMDQVMNRQMTVLISSHNLRELEDVCDQIGIMHKGKLLLERSVAALQENILKVQYVPDGIQEPDGLEILHREQVGRVRTLIARGNRERVEAEMEAISPAFYDLLPLTLEEIFIYELGGADYEVTNVIL